jgi:hypothetical protein
MISTHCGIPKYLKRVLLFEGDFTNTLAASGAGISAETYTRATAASYKNASDLVVKVGSGVVRYSAGANGVMIEQAATNLLKRSEEFDHADWDQRESTIGANATTAPDGTSTADKVQETVADDAHGVDQPMTGSGGAKYTVQVFAKADDRSFIALYGGDSTLYLPSWAWFNLGTGALGVTAWSGSTGFLIDDVGTDYSIEAYADGWYLCRATFIASAKTDHVYGVYVSNGTEFGHTPSWPTYVGTPTKGCYVWGFQVEAGDTPTSYITTVGATATRNQDKLTYPATGNLPVTAPGTIVVRGDRLLGDVAGAIIDTRSGADQQGVSIRADANNDVVGTVETTTTQAQIVTGADDWVAGTLKTCALAFLTNDVELFTSGVSRGTDAAADMPTSHTRIAVGMTGADASAWNGHVKQIRVFGAILDLTDLAVLP